MGFNVAILPAVTKDLPISPRCMLRNVFRSRRRWSISVLNTEISVACLTLVPALGHAPSLQASLITAVFSMTSIFFFSASFCSAFNGAALTTSAKPSSAMKMSFESEIGAQPPLGFWDPLGLLNDADQERFERLRYVEIKHGRISMLAVLGHIVQQNVRLPGMLSTSSSLSFADMPNGVAALSKIPPLGLAQIVAFVGFLELAVMKNVEGSFPGDFTNGGNPFGSLWEAFSEETKESKRAIELNNGRAAQMGILAMMVHEELSNQPYIINDLIGASYTFN